MTVSPTIKGVPKTIASWKAQRMVMQHLTSWLNFFGSHAAAT